jgi:uncharacterized DUF497 family protein
MRLGGIEWDEEQNTANKLNHSGLSFEVAQHVFSDPGRIERPVQSEGSTSGEMRWQILGRGYTGIMADVLNYAANNTFQDSLGFVRSALATF